MSLVRILCTSCLAITNSRRKSILHQFAPFADPQIRHIIYSSASSLIEANRTIDYDSENNGLTQLVALGHKGKNEAKQQQLDHPS